MATYGPLDQSPEARAFRDAPANPRPVCRDFTDQPEPSAFWCGGCGWNRPLHDDEPFRAAVAAELQRLATPAPQPVCPGVSEYGHGLTARTVHWGCCPASR